MTDRTAAPNLLLALGLLLFAGTVVAYPLFGRATDLPVVAPTQPNAAPVHTARPTPPSRAAPPIPSPPEVPAARPTTAAPGEPVGIAGIEEHWSVTCTGGEVRVSGIRNTVAVVGHCASITVSGIENVLTADTADRIEASGIRNRVTFHDGDPQIEASYDNVVERG